MMLAAAVAADAHAQAPSLPNPTPPSDIASDVIVPATPDQPVFAPPYTAVPPNYAGQGSIYAAQGAVPPPLPPPPPPPTVERGLFETVAESIFGEADANTWHPLPIWTLFSEGWTEAWVPSPNGSGGAPRQGWINAMDGNMYRLWFFTFAQAFNEAPKGNAYLGAFTLYTPLSRRLLLITNIPFVIRNNASAGLPSIDPSLPGKSTTKSYSGFGDISFTPRVLLHETKDFSLTADLTVTTPTGTEPLAGKASLTPGLGFWTNFPAGWVLRGGFSDFIPTQRNTETNHLISQLAIGQTVTPHDVPLFGDFTYYVSAVVSTPLPNGQQTSMTLTPGMRTHLGNDWYFLAGLPIPLTKERIGEIGMIFWFMKAW
jgi:hypothetical protein